MSNSNNAGGCLQICLFVGPVAAWLVSGYYAYNWIEPESFFGALKFLIAWAILGKIADIVLGAIIAGIAHFFGEGL